ncbi:tumor necrosis factor a (TNF superfamily, member 2) [Cololabis saira]|uniref:tumor necrosis factor a (TNF superfamily, member 2) n=1 Tax=Cololabis saira TaxID=129043 RepID=UPI002AD2F92B|nr:tumor necrosis factor a (TNF superfamily, member 2) [Cololabis saira]
MEGECKVVLDAAVGTEVGKQTRTSCKTTTVLLAFTLCLAAAAAAVLLFNTHTKAGSRPDSRPEEDSFDLHHTLRQVSNVRAAIHLTGQRNTNLTTSVEWLSDVDDSHSQGGLKLKNNEIVIPRTGLYFVYSQASFQVSCGGNEDDASSAPMVHLSHTVKRWSSSFGNDDSEESFQTILHSIRTACQRTAGGDPDVDGYWYSAVYMGAVFNLRKGDRLKTLMEEKMLHLLEDDAGKTFFGVFAL